MAAPLPPALENRLAALADRVRRLRTARGACWLVVALLGSAAILALLDSAVSLSVFARCLGELAWLALAAVLAWQLVLRPWREEVPFDELARRIEEHFPGLGERLLTVVNLGPGAGSPRLVATLARDTELRTRDLDFTRTAPARPVARLAAAAGLMLLASVAAVAAVPGSGDRLRRLGMPWHRPTVIVPFRINVPSGAAVVRRGEPVTLSAYLERTVPGAALPDSAVLAFRDGPGSAEHQLPMIADGSGAFHVTRPTVSADFEYRIEAGPTASDWFTVAVADPVELAPESTAEIIPPAYAAAVVPVRTSPGLAELEGLQHSTARLQLRFTRPAAVAELNWWPADGPPVPVHFTPDRTGGTASVRLRHGGTLRLILDTKDGPRHLRTEVPIPVRVTPDIPPRFEQVDGVPGQPRAVRPGDRVLVTFTATDDIGIGGAVLEYTVGTGTSPTGTVPVVLTGTGIPRAEGRVVLDLAGKGKAGDVIRFRVRVSDTRRVDDLKVGPQETTYPPGGWAELHLTDSAPPLDQQEVFGQRDTLQAALKDALKEVTEARDDMAALRPETGGRSPVPFDHATRITTADQQTAKAAGWLRAAAKEAALTAELRPLATAAREIADHPLAEADAALRKAGTDNPADRVAALTTAGKHLTEAVTQIEALIGRNARLAQDRLDRRRLDTLAADQQGLAARPGPSDELAKAQHELQERLAKMTAESEPLGRAGAAAFAKQARALAAAAGDLNAQLRNLSHAAADLRAEARRGLLDRLAASEAALSDRAAGVLARGGTAARLAGVIPPRPEDFRRVADLLARDQLIEAQVELEKIAANLDRVAAEFERWAADRADPKLAARQLAQWQDDLRTRLVAATATAPFEKLPDGAKAAVRAEQRIIRDTTAKLPFPPGPAVAAARTAALDALQTALDAVNGDGTKADPAMTAAAGALTRLAEKCPTVAERLATARGELDAIRRDQEIAGNAADKLLVDADRGPLDAAGLRVIAARLAEVRERQEKLAPRLAALDLPGHGFRQARTVAALRAAGADMGAGLPFDSAASLTLARRELDRLKQAIDGTPPADARAAELAAREAQLAGLLTALGDAPAAKALEPLAATQADLGKQLLAVIAPETPVLLHDARIAVRAAELAYRDSSKPAEIRQRATAAAESLEKLTDRLAGAESDLDRVKRIAANRRAAAAAAKAAALSPPNPERSREAVAQLGREADELVHTRVGAPGQPLKKVVFDHCTRLRAAVDPDRLPSAQTQLADALDRLAAAMAPVAELAAARPRGPEPTPPTEADGFLPSAGLADALRDLARANRALRDLANALPAEAARRSKPAEGNPLADLVKKQRGIAAATDALARTLASSKDPAAADAAKAGEAAAATADRLALGQLRPAREAGELAAQRLKQLAAGTKPWSGTAARLAADQEAVLAALRGSADSPAAAAAQQSAFHDELAMRAAELAGRMERAAEHAMPGGDTAKALTDAAGLAKAAGKMLADAGAKARDGADTDAETMRAGAEKMLQEATAKAAAAAGPATEPDGPMALGEALRQAREAMQDAERMLGVPGSDPATAREAMTRAADALDRAAKGVGESANPPPPSGSPNPGTRSNGNPGTTPAPTSAGSDTGDPIEKLGQVWGELPGEVKGKVIQDLRARYGEDYARSIKLYFEQLAERK